MIATHFFRHNRKGNLEKNFLIVKMVFLICLADWQYAMGSYFLQI
jgi:hypothetical protein